ncbi:hypothetical protein SBD_1831 [Streptomyces bottropensis ATCC 25435]|uniref:Uncharacterized protein n=1 Tax=Streptomyces bottropensis ATCC 25435 TaxID=1054862 RepID=M3F594_9ACTN|nr:hypothetical protein SBD_1831 [Streptomyces bottropensis ATCC 25435]
MAGGGRTTQRPRPAGRRIGSAQDERPCGVQELRTALVNAGDVDAAARR